MLWGLGIRQPSEVAKLEERLTTAGFPTIDISGIEAAQVPQLSLDSHALSLKPSLHSLHNPCMQSSEGSLQYSTIPEVHDPQAIH